MRPARYPLVLALLACACGLAAAQGLPGVLPLAEGFTMGRSTSFSIAEVRNGSTAVCWPVGPVGRAHRLGPGPACCGMIHQRLKTLQIWLLHIATFRGRNQNEHPFGHLFP